MRSLINSAAATAMCAMVAASLAPSQAVAGVVSLGEQAKIHSASPVEQVYYRHYYHRYYHPRYVHRHYYRRYYGYAPYYYNPVGAAVGTAAAVATIPFWGWGYPY